jgi:Helix-turn-helix domain
MDDFSRQNFCSLLKAFRDKGALSTRKIAAAIGCSEPTLNRLLAGRTLPSDEMLKQGGAMMEIGFRRYSKLSGAEKEKISEVIGSVGGGAIGFASITAAVGTVGSVSGLSAAGISSGLATLGGTMAGGILVAATIPVAAAAAGYGIIKGVKYVASEYKLRQEKNDLYWEIII